jgi:NitT/TauT family transport system substrate-binding protein
MFSVGSPEIAKANIDVTKTYTNAYVENALKTTGTSTK